MVYLVVEVVVLVSVVEVDVWGELCDLGYIFCVVWSIFIVVYVLY